MRKQSCMKPQVAMTALMGLFLTVPLFTNSRKGPNIVSSATAWRRRMHEDHVCILRLTWSTRLAPIMLERLADQVASTTPTSTSGLRKVNCGRGGWRRC